MKHREIKLDFTKPQVMAILNVTPDSFYGGCRSFSDEDIKHRVMEIITQGASIIDIGGYSSRPNADDISLEEEWNRVSRALRIVRKIAPDIAVSIDTFRAEVAQRAICEYGEVIINDISAGEIDSNIIEVAAQYDVPYIAMHMRGTPQTMQSHCDYGDVVEEVLAYFVAKCKALESAGVKRIIIDPGFGFSKGVEDNFRLLDRLHVLTELGYPILSGISRKSMIYKTLESSPKESLTGTIALNWESLRQGASIIRVHDVKEGVEVVKLYNAIKNNHHD